MAAPTTKLEDKSSQVKLTFERARWPKISLENEIKEDLVRSFNIFDKDGQGLVSLNDVKIALRGLGHDVDSRTMEALKLKFPSENIDLNNYIKVLSDWILSANDDADIAKSFDLFDTDGKGYINLEDLRNVREQLGFSNVIQDEELIEMLSEEQVKDSAKELKEIYADRQQKARSRKALYNGITREVEDLDDNDRFIPHRSPSSVDTTVPSELKVDLEQFKRILRVNSPPHETA